MLVSVRCLGEDNNLLSLQATTTQDSEQNYNYCVYDSDISTGFGVGAFLFLMASQAIIMVASRCFCCGKASRTGGSRSFALLLFILCWYDSNSFFNTINSSSCFSSSIFGLLPINLLHRLIWKYSMSDLIRVTFIIAEACLLAGSVRNAYHTKYVTIFSENPPSCQTVRKGVFAAGAAFTFFTCILSQFYYIYYSSSREAFAPYGGEAGVGLGTFKWGMSVCHC